jgi:hypothetical protein
LERPWPGGVFPALLVGDGELLGVGVGDRCRDVDAEGDGDALPERPGAEPEGGKLLEEPGAVPFPLPVVPCCP